MCACVCVCAMIRKFVQKSHNNIHPKSFREVRHFFREVSAYFWEVSAYFRLETSFQNFERSFEKFGAIIQEPKSSPKSKFWGRISGGRPSGYPGGRPGPKTSVRPSKSWREKNFGADVHDLKARGVQKNFGQKTSGLNFRSLIMATGGLERC